MTRVTTLLMCVALLAPATASRAEEPAKKADDKGRQLFDQAWKYDQGLGTTINTPEAIRLYRESAAAGNPLAKGRLATIYFSGRGVPETKANKAVAEKWAKGILPDVLKEAKNGNGVAQLIVSYMYLEGLDVPRDQDVAMNWLFKAADQDLPAAWTNVGAAYQLGVGIDRNPAQAVAWFQKAATEGNNATAQTFLGIMYMNGDGVARDYYQAAYWFRLGTARGNAQSQTNLGYLYDHGLGMPCNHYEAARLYRLAADQHFAPAEHNLGVDYQHGCGVPCNIYEAVRWYREAAAQGEPNSIEALHDLGY